MCNTLQSSFNTYVVKKISIWNNSNFLTPFNIESSFRLKLEFNIDPEITNISFLLLIMKTTSR